MKQPTIVVRMGNSYLARSERGEILEATELVADEDGLTQPDWDQASICDMRGAGGQEGYEALVRAFEALEANARRAGFTLVTVPDGTVV